MFFERESMTDFETPITIMIDEKLFPTTDCTVFKKRLKCCLGCIRVLQAGIHPWRNTRFLTARMAVGPNFLDRNGFCGDVYIPGVLFVFFFGAIFSLRMRITYFEGA